MPLLSEAREALKRIQLVGQRRLRNWMNHSECSPPGQAEVSEKQLAAPNYWLRSLQPGSVWFIMNRHWLLVFVGGCSLPLQPERSENELCGEENVEKIAEIVCEGSVRRCELQAACCRSGGYPGPPEGCTAYAGKQCRDSIRDSLRNGACFLSNKHNPECLELILEPLAECSTVRLYSQELHNELLTLGCGEEWKHGSLAPGLPCTDTVQCSEPDTNIVSACVASPADNGLAVCHVGERREVGQSCEIGVGCPGPIKQCGRQGVCVESKAPGEPCLGNSECASDLCVDATCQDTVGQACGGLTDCGFFAECLNGLCQRREYVSESRCDFTSNGAPEHACHLSQIVADHVSIGARSCSGFPTEEEAGFCFATAVADGVDSFWISSGPLRIDLLYQTAIVAQANGQLTEFFSSRGDTGGPHTVVSRTACRHIDGDQWLPCPGTNESSVLCEAD